MLSRRLGVAGALAGIGWAMWLDAGDGRPAIVATLVQMAVSAAYYRVVLKRRGWTAQLPS